MLHIRKFSSKKSFSRGWLRLLAVVAIAAIFIAGCSSDDDAEPEASTTTVAPSATPAPTTTTSPPPTTSSPPTTSVPTTAPPPAPPEYDIAAGVNHSCTLNDGRVFCWGSNLHGQLGNGESGATAHSSTPVEVPGISDAVAVGAGWEHTCAVHATGEVSCWGDNSRGELGNGETTNSVALPVKVDGLDDAIDITAGHWHTCALRSAGSVSCWGSNHDGQLGNDDIGVDSAAPVRARGVSDAVSVSANGEHSCAVHATGEVSCWGDNWQGELGNGESGAGMQSSVPVKVSGVTDALEVASGFNHTCALRESGKVSCWGDNEFGQIGNGQSFIEGVRDNSFFTEPDEVVSLDDAIAIAAGGAFSCAVRETGEISCWGNNSDGQLGNGEKFFSNPSPVAVSGIDDAIGVAVGASHTCALREGGAVSCSGTNIWGELGNGQDDLFTSEQVKVMGIDDAVAISSSSRHSCVLHENGEVSCWGSDWKGQTGDAATGGSPPVPIKIDGISDATQMAAGTIISCAVRENGEIPCWGSLIPSGFIETDDGEISPVPTSSQLQAALGIGTIEKIDAEGGHVCGLQEDGTIRCAGFNVFGQLGSGEFDESLNITLASVTDIDDATDISLGNDHTCALHETGEISCWGRNHYGQLGNGEEHVGSHSAVPQRVAGITDAIAVEAGAWTTTCALHETGEVSCWGQSGLGELGTNADPSNDHSAVPVKIEGIADAIAVTAGLYHVCALHESGEVSCWGAGYFGQLGTDEAVADSYSAAPVKTSGISDATAISAGRYHTCALHPTGEVTCWGSNISGQLGSGRPLGNPDSATPVTVSGLPVDSEASVSDIASDIDAGANHSCTLKAGKVLCWGSNLHGQLGNGESGATAHSSVPVEAEGITDAVAVGTGMEHSCAVHATGEVSCWGDDSRGELGNGETANSVALPVKVIGLDNAIDVTAGHWHTCALHSTGAVSCWGSNHDGQLGNGYLGVDSAVPVRVRGISDAVSVSADGEHSCAVHRTGEVSCWGDNWQGELGNGESGAGMESDVPVKVSGINNALDVASGLDHTCALLEGGKVSCWGNNEFGQIGNGRDFLTEVLNDSFITGPDEVVSLDGAIAITAGSSSSCALRETGEISCWGNNSDGQLGNNEIFFSNPSPVSVSGIDDAIGVAAGAGHTCALREGGAISCFGSNIWGELGDGQDDLFTSDQVKVIGIDDATAVSSTSHHSCVLHSNGEVSCWGSGWKGVVGDLATGDSPPVPIKIDGVSDAIDMSAGTLISCAVGENNEILCWGPGGEYTETEDGEISPVATSSQLQASLGIESIKKIDAEGAHLCLLETAGKVTCAGANNVFGQLGSGEFARDMIFEFANVPGIDDATDISLGYDHTCALHEAGEISCWGRNHYGQLGNGEEKVGRHSAVPQQVVGITDAIAVETGALTTTCALHENGEVSCWGQSDLGELGTNADPSDDHSAVPVKIEGIADAIAVAAGLYHVCALHETGEVSCWGAGYFGQLGNDEEVADGYSAAPVKAIGISDATAISAGHHHTCALHPTGEVTCWGSNIFGQLGSGKPLANHLSVIPVTVNLN